MNRITRFVHGRGTVSDAVRHHRSRDGVPSGMLAFSEMRRPVVFWNITYECNLACSHCYIEAQPGAGRGDELSTAEAQALIDDLARMRVPLILFSGGEPLMREDFWELAEHAKVRGIKTALSTNGTLITPDVARRLQDRDVEYVGISLDGACEGTHDALRAMPGSFRRAIAGIKNCAAIGLACGIRVTATRENHHEMAALIDLAKDLGVQRFCVYWLVPSGRGRDLHASMQLTSEQVTGILDLLYRRARETDPQSMEFLTVDAPQDRIYLLNTLKREDLRAYEDMCTLLRYSGVGCSAGDRVANIDPVGNVYPCQFAQLAQLKIGNVREQPFSTLWNDPDNAVLSVFRRKIDLVQGACSRCSSKVACGGGCRIRAYAAYGDLMAEDPFCILSSAGSDP
jgi:Fe-coproporphyrin III synthase